MVRLHRKQLTALDSWIGSQSDKPSRPEAIRRLVEQALVAVPARRRDVAAHSAGVAQAEKMAGAQIDRALKDIDQPDEIKAQRKRRLTKGPAEFRR